MAGDVANAFNSLLSPLDLSKSDQEGGHSCLRVDVGLYHPLKSENKYGWKESHEGALLPLSPERRNRFEAACSWECEAIEPSWFTNVKLLRRSFLAFVEHWWFCSPDDELQVPVLPQLTVLESSSQPKRNSSM